MKRKWNEQEYFSYLNIPDTWNNLEEFVDWYMESKMPVRIPQDTFVFTNENVTATVLFRHKNFQVELYLGFPNKLSGEHFHPGMEVIIMQIAKLDEYTVWGLCMNILKDGHSHIVDSQGERGVVFLSFEKWEDESRMTSASANWTGKTDGPLHDALIKHHYPESFVSNGYAVVSKTDKKLTNFT